MTKNRVQIEGPSDSEVARINELLNRIGGRNVIWGAQQVLDVWVVEARLDADKKADARMLLATWVLAIATIALVVATFALVFHGE